MNATINLIIQLLSGAAGGNIIGNILKQYNLGPLGNSIAGIIGGGLGGQLQMTKRRMTAGDVPYSVFRYSRAFYHSSY
jgi:uncharacterized membrane protein YeaQ/YmgE (transglycosylase-associated protein family)